MYFNLSAAALGHHNLSLEQLIELATDHDLRGVDPPMAEIEAMSDPLRARERIEAAGLCWGSMGLPLNFRSDDEAAKDGLPGLSAQAQVAKQIGCNRCATWICPFHDAMNYDENFEAHVRRLRPACQILSDHDIRFGIEFVGPKTLRAPHRHEFIHTMDQALLLADAIGTGNVGLLLDSFHWHTTQATASDIKQKLNNEKIVLVHINDAIAGRTADQQIDRERALPGQTGVIDLKAFFKALEHIKYDGPVTTEPMMPQLGEVSAADAIAETAKYVKRLPVDWTHKGKARRHVGT